MTLPTLYKQAKTGKTQVFNISTEEDTITVTWGQLGGKQQSKQTVCSPKNVGRSNETTGAQQAELEAKAIWVKKQKANYSESIEAPVTTNLPMKLSNYHDHKSKVRFPCYTSVKLNGVNVEYRLVEGELKLLSRGGEEYPIPDHQREEAIALIRHLDGHSINGEMYCHGEHLQDIMAATKKHNELTPRLVFHIFDFPTVDEEYGKKCERLYPKVAELELKTIATINVGIGIDHEDLTEQHDELVEAGYEGLVIRNATSKYVYNTRSLDMFKYKVSKDGEFKVVSYKLDKNGHAVFECLCDTHIQIPTKENAQNGISTMHPRFSVKLKGTNEERLAMAAEADSYIGQYLKVEFETLSKDGVPLKPVGVMFRRVDDNGEAIE